MSRSKLEFLKRPTENGFLGQNQKYSWKYRIWIFVIFIYLLKHFFVKLSWIKTSQKVFLSKLIFYQIYWEILIFLYEKGGHFEYTLCTKFNPMNCDKYSYKKLIEITDLYSKCHFYLVSGLSQKFKLSLDHPVYIYYLVKIFLIYKYCLGNFETFLYKNFHVSS